MIKIIISKANGDKIYCCNFASEKSKLYTLSTLIIVIKKIIIHKNAKGISIPKEICLSAKANIVAAINKRENKVKLKILPLIIRLNSLINSLRKFVIILEKKFYNLE